MKHAKALSLFLALVLLSLALFSCSGTDSAETTAAVGGESTASPQGTEPASDLVLADNGSSDYRIIVSEKNANALAESVYTLIERVEEKTDVSLPFATDLVHPLLPDSTPTDCEILIGTVRSEEYLTVSLPELSDLDYVITAVGKRILIIGGSVAATIRGVTYFTEHYLPSEKTATWTLSAETNELRSFDKNGLLTVMSFNLLHGGTDYTGKNIYGEQDVYVDQKNNSLDSRRSRVRSILLSYLPDVVGMQEVSNWHSFLENDSALKEAGYRLMRCSKNQKISIYYNSSTLTALDSGSIYLTEDPENLACSKLWNSDGNPRLAHFVRFKINATGETFVAVNTHIGFENAFLQTNQTIVVGEYCARLAEKYGDAVVCTGDFNSSYGTEHYKAFTDLGLMGDTRFLATESSTGTGSFHGFGSSKLKDYAIDQVMVSKGDWTVYTYAVDYTMFGKYLYYSDHYAVVSTLLLTPKD